MRLGGPVHLRDRDAEAWIADLQRLGYGAAIFALNH